VSKNKTALITGVTGQDGSYLAELLLAKGYVVHGLRRRNSSFNTSRIDHLLENQLGFHLHDGDMTDSSGLFSLLSETQPDEVYNLAAQSHVGSSFYTPEYTANVDALGTLRLLEGIRQNPNLANTRFYQASTSELFGNSPAPQNEQTVFAPRSPYAVSKLYAHWITINYRESYGIYAACGILFNHESSRRGPTFVSQKIISGINRHLKDPNYYITLGNLDSRRDWGHAREYVEAMWLLLQLEKPRDLVIGTGVSYSVRDFATRAAERKGIKVKWVGNGLDEVGVSANGDVLFRVSSEYFRPSEVTNLEADARLATEILGWAPTVDLTLLIDEMFASGTKL